MAKLLENTVINVFSLYLDDVSKSVFKATFANMEEPKQKHVAALLQYCNKIEENGSDVDVNEMQESLIHELVVRLQHKQWNVVMKALILLGRIISDTGDKTMKSLLDYKSPPSENKRVTLLEQLDILSVFLDSHASAHDSSFVNQYSTYLHQKILCFAQNNFVRIESKLTTLNEWLQTLSIEQIMSFLQNLQTCFEKALLIEVEHDNLVPIIKRALITLAKDSFRLYVAINGMVVVLLESYDKMKQADIRKFYDIAVIFYKQNQKFEKWTSTFIDHKLLESKNLPKFEPFPETFLQSLYANLSTEDREIIANMKEEKMPIDSHITLTEDQIADMQSVPFPKKLREKMKTIAQTNSFRLSNNDGDKPVVGLSALFDDPPEEGDETAEPKDDPFLEIASRE